jgi:hypothetical protein
MTVDIYEYNGLGTIPAINPYWQAAILKLGFILRPKESATNRAS